MPYKFEKNHISLFFALISVFLLPFYIQGNSFFTILFGVSSLVFFFNEISLKKLFRPFLILSAFFFIILIISALNSENNNEAMNSLGKKVMIIAFPIIFWIIDSKKIQWLKPILSVFVLSTLIALISSLAFSIYMIIQGSNINILTHSDFTQIIGLQSTYLALYMLVSVFILYFSFQYDLLFENLFSKSVKTILILFLIIFIILIATRILYIPLILFLIYILFNQLKTKLNFLIFFFIALFSISCLFYATNKVPLLQNRISEFSESDFSVLKLDKFEYNTPINGLTMRLLFSKFGLEVLKENKTLLTGEGLGDSQEMLHCKFVEYNFYLGNPLIGDTGYLNYNYHNQYMQLLVQTGIIGIVAFVLIFFVALNRRNPLLNAIILTYLILFLVESAIERQNGISHIFFFISLLVNIDLKRLKIV